MSAISKHWSDIIHPGVNCATLTHPGRSCRDHLRFQMRSTVWGNAQFFMPVAMLRFLMLTASRRTVSWEIAGQALYEFVFCCLNGWAVSNSWSAGFCALYRWFGTMVDPYSVALPGLPGTLVMFLMPAYVKMSHSRAIFNVFLECWMKSREHPWVEYARESKVIGTLAFMTISATIGHFAQRTKIQEFWFFQPLKKVANSSGEDNNQLANEKPCLHRQDCCRSFILEGMKTCFTFGMALELARKLIAVAPKLRQNPAALLEAFARIRLKFVAFLTLYSGLFRFITCLLARTRRKPSENDTTVAAFISGLTYSLSPNYNIFNLGVAAMLQNAWNFVVERYANVDLLQKINRLSFSSIVWVFLMNYNMYSRAYYPYAMSKFAMKFTDICSSAQAQTAAECLGKVAMGFS